MPTERRIVELPLYPSSNTTADWNTVSAAIRNNSFFSACVEDERLLGALQKLVGEAAENGWSVGGFIDEALQKLEAIAISPETVRDDKFRDSYERLYDVERLRLIYLTQWELSDGFRRFNEAFSPYQLYAYPAWEFHRQPGAKEENKRADHVQHEGEIRLKTDIDYWLDRNRPEIGGFGNPYGPWGFNSWMRELPVRRREAEALGLIQPGEKLTVPPGLAEWGLPQALDGMGRAGTSDLTPDQQQNVIDRCDKEGIKVVREDEAPQQPRYAPERPQPVQPKPPVMPERPTQPQFTPKGPTKPVPPPPRAVEPPRPVEPAPGAPEKPTEPKPTLSELDQDLPKKPKTPALRIVPDPSNPADPRAQLDSDWLDAWLIDEAHRLDEMQENDWLSEILGMFLAGKLFKGFESLFAGKRRKNGIPMPDGTRCFTEDCQRHKGTTREGETPAIKRMVKQEKERSNALFADDRCSVFQYNDGSIVVHAHKVATAKDATESLQRVIAQCREKRKGQMRGKPDFGFVAPGEQAEFFVSGRTIKESIENDSHIEKSENMEAHLTAASMFDRLWEASKEGIRRKPKKDTHKDKQIRWVHERHAIMKMKNVFYRVKMTAFEYKKSNNDNLLYDIKVTKSGDLSKSRMR